jgi:GTP-binding protein EngB required for normal cell division
LDRRWSSPLTAPSGEDDSYLGDPGEAMSLNSSQKLHLLTSFQYVDKLLGDIEAIMAASSAKSAFPKYKPDISRVQIKIVQDYIDRLRSEMVRVLKDQDIFPPEPRFGSVHSIRITLGFAGIAFDECRAKVMSGYGELADSAIPDLNGLVGEMKGLVEKLDAYLGQDLGQDLQLRLETLHRAGADIGMVQTLERIINVRGLVELRAALTNIVGRLESTSFEIAVFGRVSSGKSSLLNHILGANVLPVGVNPVTSVPTRIAYGATPRGMAWFASGSPQKFEIERLPELVTEQFNPANSKHITRVLVELPAPRLRDGVVYVDTPGLGSLASAGSAETMAYLPRCDLGVVLIDAGASLAADDVSTIRTLYEAGIPALVLLSKSDLLAADDLERVRQYAVDHIRSELGLELAVHAVSVQADRAELLERWFEEAIVPLYDRHVELARESLGRKIGVLRSRVEAALRSKLKRSEGHTGQADAEFQAVSADLRRAAGRFVEVRAECFKISDAMRELGQPAIERAAGVLVESGEVESGEVESGQNAEAIVSVVLEQAAAEHAAPIAFMARDLANTLTDTLIRAAAVLGLDGPEKNELAAVLADMPRLDLGRLAVDVHPNRLVLRISLAWATRGVENRLWAQAGFEVTAAFSNHGKLLEAWIRRTFAALEARFDSYADAYRAQLGRRDDSNPGTAEDEHAIQTDLESLGAMAESRPRIAV